MKKITGEIYNYLRRYRSKWAYICLSVALALSITVSYQLPSYGNRWFDILRQGIQVIQIWQLSDEQEVELGEKINETLLSSGEIRLVQNNQINRYIREIGEKLAKESARNDIPYKFQVVEDESINAFATMGGYVYINTGLIKAARNEAELASVIAHEIGHIAGRHGVQRLRQQAIAEGITEAAGLEESTVVQLGIEVGFNLPRSREDELEADQLGLENMKAVGYAPIGMINFMETLLQYSSNAPSILSTHPATSERIVALEEQINPATANQGAGLDESAHQRAIKPIL